LNITEVALSLGGASFCGFVCSINFAKNGFGYNVGDIFENSSGHPACQRQGIHTHWLRIGSWPGDLMSG
jgi:hypothetical protein